LETGPEDGDLDVKDAEDSPEGRRKLGERSYSLAKLFGIVTLTAVALGAGIQLGSAMGFLLLMVLYMAVLIAGLRRIEH
jgi:hypothetical protein